MAAAAAMAEQESARNGARNRGGVQRVEGKLRASVEKGRLLRGAPDVPDPLFR